MRDVEVVVLNNKKQFVNYVHPAVARRMVTDGLAVVYAKDPFTIQLVDDEHQNKEIKWLK